MVRRPSAVLGRARLGGPLALAALGGVALLYLLVARSLPSLEPVDVGTVVAATIGVALVVALVTATAVAVDAPLALAPALLGSGLIVAALDVSGATLAATPFETLLFACVGVAFAAILDSVALALAVALFVAAIDVASVLAGGGADTLLTATTASPGDALAIDLPAWGSAVVAARLSAADVVFAAIFAAYARRFGLRRHAASLGMLLGLVAAIVAEAALDTQLPALALLAAGYLLPNADRLLSAVNRR